MPTETEELETPTGLVSEWVKDVARLTAPEPKPEPKKDTDGKTDTSGRSPEPKPDAGHVVASDGKSGTMGEPKPEPAKVDGAKPEPKKPDDKPKAKEDWETAPTPKEADWKKWKEGRRVERDGLKKEITEREERIQTLQNQLKEVETKVATSSELPETIKAEIKSKDDQIKALTERIMVLDVTEHPKFKSYFQGKIDSAITKAKKLAGAEKADTIEKIIKLPDSEYKTAQLEEFMSDIPSELTKSRLAVVLEELDNVAAERESEIAKANEHKGKLSEEQQAKAKQTFENRQKMFETTLKQVRDVSNGFPLFQFKDGDDAYNQQVTQRIESAKGLLFNPQVPDDVRMKAAFLAVAAPHIIKSYTTESEAWQKEKSDLEAKIAELVAAQPKPGTGGADSGETHFRPKVGMKPHEITKGFVADALRRVNEG